MNRNICRRLLFTALIFIAFLMCLTGCTEPPSLALVSVPDKTVYEFGEDLDLTGGKLCLTVSGVNLEFSMADNPDVTYLNYDAYVLGEQTVTVVYRYGEDTNLTVSFSVSVKKRSEKETGIRVVPSEKISYVEGQPFDAEGLKVFLKYEDGTETEVTEGYTLSVGENVALSDNGAVTVTYHGFKASFRIEVLAREITELVFVKEPSKKSYVSGEPPDLSGAELAYRFNDGTLETVAIDTKFKILPKVFHFGESKIQIADTSQGTEFPILTFDVQVEKKSTRADVSATVKKMIRNVPETIESVASYEKLYLEFSLSETDFFLEEWTLAGKAYTYFNVPTIQIDAASALNASVKAFEFGDASEPNRLRIHLYALLSCGSDAVELESKEEIVTIVLCENPEESPALEYRATDNRLTFFGESAETVSVVHMFADTNGTISVIVQIPSVSPSSERFVKLPSGFVPSAVWGNSARAIKNL